MFSLDDLEKIRQAMAQLGSGAQADQGKGSGAEQKKSQKGKDAKQNKDQDGCGAAGDCINLNPSQLLIIAGFLTGTLQVESVLVNRNQSIEIVLVGTLKKKTQLDKLMGQVGKMPFERVVQAIIDNSDG